MIIGLIFNFCLYGSLFCLAIDLHQTHGLDALSTGLAMLPTTLVVGAFAFLSGRMVARFGEWQPMLVGLTLTAGFITALLVALNATHGAVWVLIASSTPPGITALAMPAMTAVVIGSVPGHRIGLASGALNAAVHTLGLRPRSRSARDSPQPRLARPRVG